MNRPHALRNWLHLLLLAVQAADPDAAARSFSRTGPLDIVGPLPDRRWTEWRAWHAFLNEQLGPYRPGSIRVRLQDDPTIEFSAAAARLRCSLSYRLPNAAPRLLECDFTLVEENQQWTATRLWMYFPPAV